MNRTSQRSGDAEVQIATAAIDETLLHDSAVSARTMAQNAITRTTAPTVIQALALVDSIIAASGLTSSLRQR